MARASMIPPTSYNAEDVRAYATAAVLAERERCAKIAAEMDFGMGEIAAEIRKG